MRLPVFLGEQFQRVDNAPIVAPIVDDKAISLTIGRAVDARDGLQERVLAQGRVQIENLLNRRIEARQRHVADNENFQRIVELFEPRDEIISLDK
jgi:hypothetical protein